jgi:hypothetical protein
MRTRLHNLAWRWSRRYRLWHHDRFMRSHDLDGACPPGHPNLDLDRAMTREEMLDALAYEGMFGIGELDLGVARQLAAEGLVEVEWWDKGRGWHVCDLRIDLDREA